MKVSLISLGCDKNLVDSELMLALIAGRGYEYTDDIAVADIAIVNTCCFIMDAKEESIEAILDTARYKTEGELKALIVTGCMAQRYKEEIKTEIPEVDALLGTSSYDRIVEVIDSILKEEVYDEFLDLDRLPNITANRRNISGSYYAYLKIAEGCDKNCTYCIIPSLRGHYRSYPIEDLLTQARNLCKEGVKELILVAQETTLYGTDIYGEKSLPRLLRELCKIEELSWIRILYCYPEEITDEFIEVLATEDKICKYLDIPIQHASDKMLRRMGRRTNKASLIDIITRLRKKVPDIALRTTLITGFPGESEEDVAELREFVEDMRFERLGVFCYSMEEGTVAAGFDNQLEEEIKEQRRDMIMSLQQEISREKLNSRVGEELEVIIEGKLTEDEVYVARTYMDNPGVDGYMFVSSDREYMSGDFVKVKVTSSSEYDLIGEAI